MGYKVLKGKLTPLSKVPESVEDEEEPVTVRPVQCPHGYMIHSACSQCNIPREPLPVPVDHPSLPPKCKHNLFATICLHCNDSSFEDIFLSSRLDAGDKVARKIRMHEIGVVESVEYLFEGTIKNIWVNFGRVSTPYHPMELKRMKIH
jgi:hypothetical protein